MRVHYIWAYGKHRKRLYREKFLDKKKGTLMFFIIKGKIHSSVNLVWFANNASVFKEQTCQHIANIPLF